MRAKTPLDGFTNFILHGRCKQRDFWGKGGIQSNVFGKISSKIEGSDLNSSCLLKKSLQGVKHNDSILLSMV